MEEVTGYIDFTVQAKCPGCMASLQLNDSPYSDGEFGHVSQELGKIAFGAVDKPAQWKNLSIEDDKGHTFAVIEKSDGSLVTRDIRLITFCNDEKAYGIDNVLGTAGRDWITNYLKDENFPPEHIRALQRIIMFFNDSKEAENGDF